MRGQRHTCVGQRLCISDNYSNSYSDSDSYCDSDSDSVSLARIVAGHKVGVAKRYLQQLCCCSVHSVLTVHKLACASEVEPKRRCAWEKDEALR